MIWKSYIKQSGPFSSSKGRDKPLVPLFFLDTFSGSSVVKSSFSSLGLIVLHVHSLTLFFLVSRGLSKSISFWIPDFKFYLTYFVFISNYKFWAVNDIPHYTYIQPSSKYLQYFQNIVRNKLPLPSTSSLPWSASLISSQLDPTSPLYVM